MKIIKKAFKNYKFSSFVFLLAVVYVSRKSFGQAVNFFFWKDDWAWLWSANYNPNDFFHSTIGEDWIIRTGLFMYPYVLSLHKLIQNPYYWQMIGLSLKIINSLIFFRFIKVFFNNNHLAIIGSLLFASYSGGIESYTWYKLSALSATFVLLGFTFYGIFLKNFKNFDFYLAFVFLLLAFMSNMGRPAGAIPFIFLWGLLEMIWNKNDKSKIKKILISQMCIILPYLLLIKYISSGQRASSSMFHETLQQYNVFFGIIGNLLKNPWMKFNEAGYLYTIDDLGVNLGKMFMGTGIVSGIIYIKRRTYFFKYLTLFIAWVFIFYYPNWIFGGGGVSTTLGSGHRYLTLSGIGIISIWILILSKFQVKSAIFIAYIVFSFNIAYSRHLIDLESTLRNKYLVEPIYNELNNKMKNDNNVQLVVIDAPNILKSFVVGGWYPYTYAYYKGLKDITEFPVVIGYWDHAVSWICSDPAEKLKIQSMGGFGNNRVDNIEVNHIYAWNLKQDGSLTDKTEVLRNIFTECSNTYE